VTPAVECGACGTGLAANSKFCNECGTAVATTSKPAEYKQVTVLFADVVGSMKLAAVLDAERLREVMAAVFTRSAAVVQRFGGTVDKFTGDGIMALFGAPVALEDHAVRACLAALDMQEQMTQLAGEVSLRDGVELAVRVGLNSGRVIAGEIGSGPSGYTAVGEQVGLAQRMESVAPPGGVMIAESTARLVEGAMVLGEPQAVHIKGNDQPVAARRLLGSEAGGGWGSRREPGLVGRTWEMNAVAAILDETAGGTGCVAAVVGPPGIGKSRLVREAVKLAADRGVQVCAAFCESHTLEVPFYVVTRLLRTIFAINDLDAQAARGQVRARIREANPEDLTLLEDLIGIGDPAVAPPDIAPDARRRRLAALLNTAALARSTPVVYVIEDVHWVDAASEAMLAEFLTVVPQTPSLVLITYRPEYRGALSRAPGAQTISLAPLNPAQSATLIAELLGTDPSVRALGDQISERASGNPFFAEEMVRDLAERGVLDGGSGAYRCGGDPGDVTVPDTLQATIAARVDRLDPPAKQVLHAAAVIGLRFTPDRVTDLIGDGDGSAAIEELVRAELIDQVRFTPGAEYAFRHPLIRTVAYESQLTSGRAELHRRLAAAIETRDPAAADENAALIAEHLEAAGDLRAAFDWHMRAGAWSVKRDVGVARVSWRRARYIADLLPEDAAKTNMRIAARAQLTVNAWRVGAGVVETGYEELRGLAIAAGDHVALAVAMLGQTAQLALHNQLRDASRLASELSELVEPIGDPSLTVGSLAIAMYAKYQAGEMEDLLRLSQRVIDLADGDTQMGSEIAGSPLVLATVLRGVARCATGIGGWRDDLGPTFAMARSSDPTTLAIAATYKYVFAITAGALTADSTALRETAETVTVAEQFGDDFTLASAQLARGITLVHLENSDRREGFELLAKARSAALHERYAMAAVTGADVQVAREKLRTGDVDGAIDLARSATDTAFGVGDQIVQPVATTILVNALLQRGARDDVNEANAAADRLAATSRGFAYHELPLLRVRALLARAHGDDTAYRDFRERYRTMATDLGFEGHMKWAEAMP